MQLIENHIPLGINLKLQTSICEIVKRLTDIKY